MKITYTNKFLDEIEANLEIVLLKRSKYLKTNNMFLKEKSFMLKYQIINFIQLLRQLQMLLNILIKSINIKV